MGVGKPGTAVSVSLIRLGIAAILYTQQQYIAQARLTVFFDEAFAWKWLKWYYQSTLNGIAANTNIDLFRNKWLLMFHVHNGHFFMTCTHLNADLLCTSGIHVLDSLQTPNNYLRSVHRAMVPFLAALNVNNMDVNYHLVPSHRQRLESNDCGVWLLKLVSLFFQPTLDQRQD